jgi:hypothetical protein
MEKFDWTPDSVLNRIIAVIVARFQGDPDRCAFEIQKLTGHGKGYSYDILNHYFPKEPVKK